MNLLSKGNQFARQISSFWLRVVSSVVSRVGLLQGVYLPPQALSLGLQGQTLRGNLRLGGVKSNSADVSFSFEGARGMGHATSSTWIATAIKWKCIVSVTLYGSHLIVRFHSALTEKETSLCPSCYSWCEIQTISKTEASPLFLSPLF